MPPPGVQSMSAIIYLADGEQCRCLVVKQNETVQDLVDKMLQIQEEWEVLGGSSGASTDEGGTSTDDPRDTYGIVIADYGDNLQGVQQERVLPKTTRLDSPELKKLHRCWARTALRNLQAQFAKSAKGGGNKGQAGTATAGKKPGPKSGTAPSARREYWFTTGTGKSKQFKGQARAKFVNLDDYNIVAGKEGWVTVKDKSGKKQRWVVVKENTLNYFTDPEDTKPLATVRDVDQCKLEYKAKKGDQVSIKVSKGKVKFSLICDNDIMSSRWNEALQRGQSGAFGGQSGGGPTPEEPPAPRRVIKIKMDSYVEPIPEYTEEDEMRDEGRLPMSTPAGDSGNIYIYIHTHIYTHTHTHTHLFF